ncbi:glutathione S-transferase family protein [Aestuariicoccus sp. MJ-SS9]|uniref:glutathione S-transferase family protein n=1 Tax=Aestuariicoccus sp. MJ-SS9 TaxID=3079855 RepID=UPI00290A3BC3|nr:glutathione S-transferase family protein [Aestuariicoccus sp. MJ-SS9]MDU8911639.1 glutathione S-transferase family protein [Aestuariicoccus sp. MJ-SS9]
MSLPILYDHAGSICSQMARLALVEKAVPFQRRPVDIMDTNEQFEPWYVALNPKAVVPTLVIGNKVVTDTIRIVNRVQSMDGPDLSGDATTQGWLKDIMAPHYGVLLYRNRLDPDGTAPQIVARGKLLKALLRQHPEMADLLEGRIAGNRRFQALLRNPEEIETHLASTRTLIDRMAAAVADQPFIAGPAYSVADCFATAALARFRIHRLTEWWRGTALEAYYDRMRARPSFEAAGVIDTGSERDI